MVRVFDEPKMRHHAHGICPSGPMGIGPRLWYTHYPSGYLIPYAFLFKMGFDNIFFMRMLSVFFSIVGIILMYILFSKITSPAISFIAVFFYGLSSAFLNYADSLANQPIDDLLRFAFMLSIVLSTYTASLRQRRTWMVSAWVIGFLLSLSSFDSVFFVYLWLIGWDFLMHQGFRWKTYLIYAIAPLIAHSLQFLQNVWYLGLNNAILDIKNTFLQKSSIYEGHSRFITIWYFLITLFKIFHISPSLIALLLISYTIYANFLRDKNDRELPSMRLLIVLFLCGLVFDLIFPQAKMFYQIRQEMPFMALLVSGATWSFLKGLRKGLRYSIYEDCDSKKRRNPSTQKNHTALSIILWCNTFGILVSFYIQRSRTNPL